MNHLLKVSLRYGLLAGVIASALLIGLYYMGRHPFLIPVYIDFRIILFGIFIFFTLREIRDVYQNGVMYFWQGILGSFLFTLAYAVLSSLVMIVFMQLVPAFVSDYIALSVEQLKSLPSEVIDSIGRDVYERNLKLLPQTDGVDLGFLYFLQSFLISLFISIILSVILRRQPQT